MKRYTAPIVAAIGAGVIIAVFGGFYFMIFKAIPGASCMRLLIAGIVLAALGVLVAVLIQRIKEIKEGEEDDLGKY